MTKENITKFSINFAIEVLSYANMINQICSLSVTQIETTLKHL